MGYGPQSWPRAYAFPTRGPTRSLRENPNRKWLSENLALVIFWKSGCFLCFFNLPFLPAKHMNHTIQFAFKIIVSHQEKQEFEVSNKQYRTSKQAPTRDCLRSPSHIILRICLRRTYAPSGIAYARMMWVPLQSKIHHLEKKNVAQLRSSRPKPSAIDSETFRKKNRSDSKHLEGSTLTPKNHDLPFFSVKKSRGMWSGKCSQNQKLAKETRTHTHTKKTQL